jgi:galactose mutarotase-like enzyme
MVHELISNKLQVKIDALGAELCSVKNNSGIEFMWQANPNVWARHAPVLFPIVGKLKNDSYCFNGQVYNLPQHGFARDMVFERLEGNSTGCVFRLTESEKTRTLYPFPFALDIAYHLEKDVLTVSYAVNNTGSKELYFSIGAHPAFNVPLIAGETYEDYRLGFTRNTFEKSVLRDGLLLDEKITWQADQEQKSLNTALFDADALVFENGQIDEISLFSTKNSHKITLNCKNWPFFGIWSKKGCREFVCLEPWFGIADSLNGGADISQKKGIISLPANGRFNCHYSIRFS